MEDAALWQLGKPVYATRLSRQSRGKEDRQASEKCHVPSLPQDRCLGPDLTCQTTDGTDNTQAGRVSYVFYDRGNLSLL